MTKEFFMNAVTAFARDHERNQRAKENAKASAVFDAEFSRLALEAVRTHEAVTAYCQARLEKSSNR